MIISAYKFLNKKTGTVYLTIGKDYAQACKRAQRVVPNKNDREYIASYVASCKDCETWLTFLNDVSVIVDKD